MLSHSTSESDAQLAELGATLLLQMESVVHKWEERLETHKNFEEHFHDVLRKREERNAALVRAVSIIQQNECLPGCSVS